MAILTMVRHKFYKNDGSLNSGGKVWTYVAGTTTPAATYTSSDASVANTNPIILDSKGECDLWVTGQIKVNVLESDNTQVTGWPVDNVGSGVANNDATMRWAGTAAGTANALAITPSPAIAAYVVGQSFIFKAGASPNSAATTIAISGLTPIAAQISGSALAGGEILAGKWYSIVLDSLTTCQVEPVASAALAGSASQTFSVAAAVATTDAVQLNQIAGTYPAIASAATIDIFAIAGASVTISGTTTVTAITACTAAQVGSIKTFVPSNAAGFSITATANIVVDGATSGTYLMPKNANVQIIATSTTTFKITTIYATGTWTPVITSITGTITTVGAVSGTYIKIGRQVSCQGTYIITTMGTGATGILIGGYPFALNLFAGSSANYATGAACTLVSSGSNIQNYKYDGTMPCAAEQTVMFNFVQNLT